MKIKPLLLIAAFSLIALPLSSQSHELHHNHPQYQHHHADHWPFQIIIEPFFYLPPVQHHYHKKHSYRRYQKQHNGHRRPHRQHNPRPRHH